MESTNPLGGRKVAIAAVNAAGRWDRCPTCDALLERRGEYKGDKLLLSRTLECPNGHKIE